MKLRRFNGRYINERLDEVREDEVVQTINDAINACRNTAHKVNDELYNNCNEISNKLHDLAEKLMMNYMYEVRNMDDLTADEAVENAERIIAEINRIDKVLDGIVYDFKAVSRKVENLDI